MTLVTTTCTSGRPHQARIWSTDSSRLPACSIRPHNASSGASGLSKWVIASADRWA